MLYLLNPSLNAMAVGRHAFRCFSIQASGFLGVLTQEVKAREQIKPKVVFFITFMQDFWADGRAFLKKGEGRGLATPPLWAG